MLLGIEQVAHQRATTIFLVDRLKKLLRQQVQRETKLYNYTCCIINQ